MIVDSHFRSGRRTAVSPSTRDRSLTSETDDGWGCPGTGKFKRRTELADSSGMGRPQSGAVVAVATLAVAGCASQTPSPQERGAIVRAVKAPFVDMGHRRAGRLCDDFTEPVADQLRRTLDASARDCQAAVRNSLRKADSIHLEMLLEIGERSTVTDIKVDGSNATAQLHALGSRGFRMHLAKASDGSWRSASPFTAPGTAPFKSH